MSDYFFLIDLSSAYSNIHLDYFNKQVVHYFNGETPTTQDIERVVLAELYHQWRYIMVQKAERYNNLILHSEIGKRMSESGIQHPDLVLHGGQSGDNRTVNKILVELKMDVLTKEDIKKCLYAISEPYDYSYAICIVHNLPDFKADIKSNWDCFEHHKEYFDRFYFMNKECKLLCLNDLV